MRNNGNGFVSGMMAGMALGAMAVMAISPQMRRSMMKGAGQMGGQMTRMMRRRGNQMTDMASDMMMMGDDE